LDFSFSAAFSGGPIEAREFGSTRASWWVLFSAAFSGGPIEAHVPLIETPDGKFIFRCF